MEIPNSLRGLFSTGICVFSGNADIIRNGPSELGHIIDALGNSSAKAQGLKVSITSIDKLLAYPDQRLYLYVHTESNRGAVEDKGIDWRSVYHHSTNNTNGYMSTKERTGRQSPRSMARDADDSQRLLVVGLLKVGFKKLFIMDEIGRHHELEPLCVLDFYVHEAFQRSGIGKTLFEQMLATVIEEADHSKIMTFDADDALEHAQTCKHVELKREKQQPRKLAYDRPSPKFINFLKKYYDLRDYVPQANNFVVFKDYGLSSATESSRRWSEQFSNHTETLISSSILPSLSNARNSMATTKVIHTSNAFGPPEFPSISSSYFPSFSSHSMPSTSSSSSSNSSSSSSSFTTSLSPRKEAVCLRQQECSGIATSSSSLGMASIVNTYGSQVTRNSEAKRDSDRMAPQQWRNEDQHVSLNASSPSTALLQPHVQSLLPQMKYHGRTVAPSSHPILPALYSSRADARVASDVPYQLAISSAALHPIHPTMLSSRGIPHATHAIGVATGLERSGKQTDIADHHASWKNGQSSVNLNAPNFYPLNALGHLPPASLDVGRNSAKVMPGVEYGRSSFIR